MAEAVTSAVNYWTFLALNDPRCIRIRSINNADILIPAIKFSFFKELLFVTRFHFLTIFLLRLILTE